MPNLSENSSIINQIICVRVNNNSLMFCITINILFVRHILSWLVLNARAVLFTVRIVAFVSSNIDFHSLSLLSSLLYPENFRSVLFYSVLHTMCSAYKIPQQNAKIVSSPFVDKLNAKRQ